MNIKHNDNKGFALAFSLVFIFLILASVAILIYSATNAFTIANRSADSKRAFYVADAGIADAFIQLRGYSIPPSSFTVSNSNYSLGGASKKGSYSVSAVATPVGTMSKYTLTSTGTYNGLTKTLVLTVQQTAMSSMAYMSNTEIHPVWGQLWWITGMTTVGPVRTNGSLNIWGSPIFDGTVTQSGPSVNYWNGGPPLDNPDYVYGLTVNAPSITWPAATMLPSISAAASSGGLSLTGNSTIVFNADGTMSVTNAAKSWVSHSMSIPGNGAVYVQSGTVTVQGTVKGQVTVGGDSEVYISGNLMYATDPRTDPSSTDLLGLVAQNNVTVLAASSPSNLELDAVLVALNGSFQVDQWWVGGKGNMIQFGSLINNYCGPTGVFDPFTGTLWGGYMQLQYYDTRLQTLLPPAFPPAVDSTGRTVYVKLSFKEL